MDNFCLMKLFFVFRERRHETHLDLVQPTRSKLDGIPLVELTLSKLIYSRVHITSDEVFSKILNQTIHSTEKK
jgi:hypothetical protein